MKIALISAANIIHTVRWANGLSAAGHEVHVISQHPIVGPFDGEVQLHLFPNRGVVGYFSIALAVRKLLDRIKPDIVNAHYASGYGTTVRLAGFHPYVLSVWGSDIYDFPHKSPLHKWLVKKNLCAADQLASTSHCMAEEAHTLVPDLKYIAITPFGVDMQAYKGIEVVDATQKSRVVIGTVKTMLPKYGIDTLIEGYAQLLCRLRSSGVVRFEMELRLVGGGDQTPELKALADRLGIGEQVNFVGRVPHTQVPQELAKLDIYVALSRLDSESFGVAIIEAGAAGRPVVVSDAGGLPEVTLDGETGFVVPRENPEAAARALESLILDSDLRHRLGSAGRQHVEETYSWDACIQSMLGVYETTIENFKQGKNAMNPNPIGARRPS